MNTPLIDGLKTYIKENNLRMHMPGHKGKNLEVLSNLIPKLDVTEVRGVDNLQNPTSIIKASEENAALVFGAKETFFSVNGTTSGIYASILSQTSKGDKVLIQRDSHKSVYQALVLGELDARYVYPEYDSEKSVPLGIRPCEIEESLRKEKDIKLVVVTYPTYYGVCCDLEKIIDIVHSFGKIIVVDEAHGSHLAFNSRLPDSALSLGADIVIQSTHKTLPAFTQSSMIHVGTENVNREKLKTQINVFQTTSPSYMLMASLDYAASFADEYGKDKLDMLLDEIEETTLELKNIECVEVFDETDDDFKFDKTKLLVRVDSLTGVELETILRDDYKIQVEMSDSNYVLLLLTMADEERDLRKVVYALRDIEKRVFKTLKKVDEKSETLSEIISGELNKTKTIIPSHKAFYSDKISVQLSKAEGLIAGEFIIPYPPGVPVLVPGEEITSEIIDHILDLKDKAIVVLAADSELENILTV